MFSNFFERDLMAPLNYRHLLLIAAFPPRHTPKCAERTVPPRIEKDLISGIFCEKICKFDSIFSRDSFETVFSAPASSACNIKSCSCKKFTKDSKSNFCSRESAFASPRYEFTSSREPNALTTRELFGIRQPGGELNNFVVPSSPFPVQYITFLFRKLPRPRRVPFSLPFRLRSRTYRFW